MVKINSRAKDNSKPKFKNANYIGSLDIILKAAQDEYKQITFDRHTAQHAILRNYLWLSTLIISVEGAIFLGIIGGKNLPWLMESGIFFIIFSIISMLFSVIAFLLGIDTMRGRGETFHPYQMPYEDLVGVAYQEAAANKADGFLRITMIRHLENAISHHSRACTIIGEKLRILSRLLLASTGFSILALLMTSPPIIFLEKELLKYFGN